MKFMPHIQRTIPIESLRWMTMEWKAVGPITARKSRRRRTRWRIYCRRDRWQILRKWLKWRKMLKRAFECIPSSKWRGARGHLMKWRFTMTTSSKFSAFDISLFQTCLVDLFVEKCFCESVVLCSLSLNCCHHVSYTLFSKVKHLLTNTLTSCSWRRSGR